MFFALANPFRGTVARATVEDFTEVKAVVPANNPDRFDPAVLLNAKKFLVAWVMRCKPAKSALVG